MQFLLGLQEQPRSRNLSKFVLYVLADLVEKDVVSNFFHSPFLSGEASPEEIPDPLLKADERIQSQIALTLTDPTMASKPT